MSNDNGCTTTRTGSPRFPDPRQTDQGEPGTKRSPRGRSDGHAVKIPQPDAQARRGPRSDTAARRRNGALKGGRPRGRFPTVRRAHGRADRAGEHAGEKTRGAPRARRPVPETDTGGRGEYPQVLE